MSKVYIFRGTDYDLEKMHTKQLLNLRNGNSSLDHSCWCCGMYIDEEGMYHNDYPSEYYELKKAIYAELSKREHVMNKIESKMSRKEKKSKGRKKLAYVR